MRYPPRYTVFPQVKRGMDPILREALRLARHGLMSADGETRRRARKIIIRRSPARPDSYRWWRYTGYAWVCPICGSTGRASDRTGFGYLTQTSSFNRVMKSVNDHLYTRHHLEHVAYCHDKLKSKVR